MVANESDSRRDLLPRSATETRTFGGRARPQPAVRYNTEMTKMLGKLNEAHSESWNDLLRRVESVRTWNEAPNIGHASHPLSLLRGPSQVVDDTHHVAELPATSDIYELLGTNTICGLADTSLKSLLTNA